MLELLSLAHKRTCEAQLDQLLQQRLDERRLSDLNELRARFAPNLAGRSEVCVQLTSLSNCEALVHRHQEVQA